MYTGRLQPCRKKRLLKSLPTIAVERKTYQAYIKYETPTMKTKIQISQAELHGEINADFGRRYVVHWMSSTLPESVSAQKNASFPALVATTVVEKRKTCSPGYGGLEKQADPPQSERRIS